MPMTTRFATNVRTLRQLDMTVAEIASRLGATEADILEAHRIMGIGIADRDDEPAPVPDDAERAAARDRWPRKMQERWEKRR